MQAGFSLTAGQRGHLTAEHSKGRNSSPGQESRQAKSNTGDCWQEGVVGKVPPHGFDPPYCLRSKGLLHLQPGPIFPGQSLKGCLLPFPALRTSLILLNKEGSKRTHWKEQAEQLPVWVEPLKNYTSTGTENTSTNAYQSLSSISGVEWTKLLKLLKFYVT